MAIKFFTKHNTQKGFTLVEMIVVLGIVGVISAVTMFNYGDFRQGVDTRNLAQEIALSIRKAQSYATSSKKLYTDLGAGEQIKSFGIVFSVTNTTDPITPNNKNFILYAALPTGTRGSLVQQYSFQGSNGVCTPDQGLGITLGTECLEYFSITSPVSITKLETYANGSWIDIGTSTNLNIIFHRPTPDADICAAGSGTICDIASAGRVTITSQNGKIQKTITVWNTGQIAVENVIQPPASLNCVQNDPRIECANNGGLGDDVCFKKGGCK